jgi:hypothetical protein
MNKSPRRKPGAFCFVPQCCAIYSRNRLRCPGKRSAQNQVQNAASHLVFSVQPGKTPPWAPVARPAASIRSIRSSANRATPPPPFTTRRNIFRRPSWPRLRCVDAISLVRPILPTPRFPRPPCNIRSRTKVRPLWLINSKPSRTVARLRTTWITTRPGLMPATPK